MTAKRSNPSAELQDLRGKLEAINKVQAIIEFELDGTILTANDNFLGAVGYELEEIQGQHHRMFVDAELAASREYAEFWESLARGEAHVAEFKRYGKHGKEIWIQASYNPIFNKSGKPVKVVKFATDITAAKLEAANFAGQIDAIHKSQAVIEFNVDGTILTANDNFLAATGYELSEIVGQHHRMFVEPGLAASPEYKEFWARLGRGEFEADEYKRVRKDGSELWIQASYNPILDADGRPFKVVKFATDITQQKQERSNFEGQISAISRSQAVIEFELDGTIRFANENFLNAVGYSIDEIVGQHHRLFVSPELANSQEYADFWASLRQGKYQAGEFCRVNKAGQEVWIQASYNPIFDADFRPYKVVKYATEITDRKVAVAQAARVATRVAEGDLTDQIDGEFSGDFNMLKESLNSTTSRLSTMVSEIREASSQLASGASGIAHSNDDLSTRSLEQAAKLEEIAAAVEQITGTTRSNAGNAQSASELADNARNLAESGSEVMTETIEAMRQIGRGSETISEIVGVIDELAFQTNLLALNAAVEAARAGDHGRGFTVVASEVRNLALRSADAAKEIRSQISSNRDHVDRGVSLVTKSGDTLSEIVESVGSVTQLISTIATACEEQATGVELVRNSVLNIDRVVQKNAEDVTATARESRQMEDRAKNLIELVDFFKIAPGVMAPSAGRAAEPLPC